MKYLKNKKNIKEEELPAKPAAPLNMPADAFPECPQAFVFPCVFSVQPVPTKSIKKRQKNFLFCILILMDEKPSAKQEAIG